MKGSTEGAVLDAKIKKVLQRIESRGAGNDQYRPADKTFMWAAIEGAGQMDEKMNATLSSFQEGTNV